MVLNVCGVVPASWTPFYRVQRTKWPHGVAGLPVGLHSHSLGMRSGVKIHVALRELGVVVVVGVITMCYVTCDYTTYYYVNVYKIFPGWAEIKCL